MIKTLSKKKEEEAAAKKKAEADDKERKIREEYEKEKEDWESQVKSSKQAVDMANLRIKDYDTEIDKSNKEMEKIKKAGFKQIERFNYLFDATNDLQKKRRELSNDLITLNQALQEALLKKPKKRWSKSEPNLNQYLWKFEFIFYLRAFWFTCLCVKKEYLILPNNIYSYLVRCVNMKIRNLTSSLTKSKIMFTD